jgi:serine/threonine protein kinase
VSEGAGGAGPLAELFSPGDVVSETYRIEELIGQGGVAIVYRASQMGTRRQCALKFIRPRMLADQKMVQQFVKEARVAGRIGVHPNIVTVFEAGIAEKHGIPFIAMELVQGVTLAEHLAERGALSWHEVHTLMDQLGEALDAAHAAGVVHRDLNPGNILLSRDHKGRQVLKVLDFGIAKFAEELGKRSATNVGTPNYCAPEQLGPAIRARAEKAGFTIARDVSLRTDVWPIGLIAFEMLSGVPARTYWGSNLAQYLTKAALERHEPPSSRAGAQGALLPPGFDAWFARCTAHNSEDRFASAGEAVAALMLLILALPG